MELVNWNLLRGVNWVSIPESEVVALWQKQLQGENRFAAGADAVQVLYPGRRNDDRGADFRDAVVTFGKRLVKGHIEIHARSSDWQVHRHHLDPVYNQVVLHVTFSKDTDADTLLQNGESVPTVVLDESTGQGHPGSLPGQCPAMPCSKLKKDRRIKEILAYLDEGGDARFQAKAGSFYTSMADTEPDQCLYLGITEALGYSRNKKPFLELAQRVPLKLLQSAAREESSDEDYIAQVQALLMGSAGLMPSQRPVRYLEDQWIARLEGLWTTFRQPLAMSYTDWRLFKVRPSNSPVRRIAAMSYLLCRYRKKGLSAGILAAVSEAYERGDRKYLETALIVEDGGYWASHFDFGAGGRWLSPVLLGGERARAIVVNVLLPFALACSRIGTAAAPGIHVKELYNNYSGMSLNAVERHMIFQLGLKNREVNSARCQQGLMHIYNTLCTQGRCHACKLSQFPRK